MTAEFTKFLKDNDAYDDFMENIKDRYSKERMSILAPKYYITNAFVWAHTEQGSDYWKELSEKWTDIAGK